MSTEPLNPERNLAAAEHPEINRPEPPRGSIWRRWYLRPWVILLVSVLLLGGAVLIRPVMRVRAARNFESESLNLPADESNLSFDEGQNWLYESLTWLPPTVKYDLDAVLVNPSEDGWKTEARLQSLRWFPEATRILIAESVPLHESGSPVPDSEPEMIRSAHRYKLNLSGFYRLKELVCPLVKADETFFQRLKSCSQLENLRLCRSPLTVAGCRELGQLKSLKYLRIDHCVLNGEMLEQLPGLSALEDLSLDEPGIDDRGMKAISRLPSLRYLSIDHADLTGEAIAMLTTMNLEELSLTRTQITDAEFSRLIPGILTLKVLRLDRLPLTDVALETVARCENLHWIIVTECPGITRTGARHLAGLRHLNRLDIDEVSIELPITDPPTLRNSK